MANGSEVQRRGVVASAAAIAAAMMHSCLAIAAAMAADPAGLAADQAGFAATVAPVLRDHCIACHNAKKAEGGYRLDTFEQLTIPGDSAAAPLVSGAEAGGDPGGEILRRITADDPFERMPPDAPPLAAEAVRAVRDWVRAGARFDGDRPAEPLFLVAPPRSPPAPQTYAFPHPVTAVAFSPDGGRVVAGGCHELLVFAAADGRLLARIGGVGRRVMAIRFLADGRTMAVAGGEPGRDGDVRLVDLETESVKGVLARSADVVLDAAPRPGSDEIAVAAVDGIVRVVDAAKGTVVRAISSHGDWVTAVAYSDDGARLASASRDRSVKVYDAATGELVVNFADHTAAARGVAFSADGREVFSTADDRTLRRWSIETGKPLATVSLAGEGARPVRAGGILLVPAAGVPARSVEIAKNAVARELAHGGAATVVAVHAGTGRIVTGAMDGQVRLLDTADGALVKAWAATPTPTPEPTPEPKAAR